MLAFFNSQKPFSLQAHYPIEVAGVIIQGGLEELNLRPRKSHSFNRHNVLSLVLINNDISFQPIKG